MGDGVARDRSSLRAARLGILTAVLVGVALWAVRDVLARRGRNTWDHTLRVAVVVLRLEPVSDDVMTVLRARSGALEDRMEEELTRYRPGAPRPFALSIFGPVDVLRRPPTPDGAGLVDLALHAWNTFWYVRAVDARADVDASHFDCRIYIVVRPQSKRDRTLVEGQSEEGGRIGSVEVELGPDDGSADFALAGVAHEVFHTLGATDKYDERGKTLIPLGLAEPERRPVFPQRFVEIMAQNRPLSREVERPLATIGDVSVGPATAREIGWSR